MDGALGEDGGATVTGEEGGFVGCGGGAGGGAEGSSGGVAGVEIEEGEAVGLSEEAGEEFAAGDVGGAIEVVTPEKLFDGADFLIQGGQLAEVAGVLVVEIATAFAAEVGEIDTLGRACIGGLLLFKFIEFIEEGSGEMAKGGGRRGGVGRDEEEEEIGAGERIAVGEDGAVAESRGEEGEAGGGDVGLGEAKRVGKAAGEGLEGFWEGGGGVFKI